MVALREGTKRNPPLGIHDWGSFLTVIDLFFFFLFNNNNNTKKEKKKIWAIYRQFPSLSSMSSDQSFNESQPIESRSELIRRRRRRRYSRRTSFFISADDLFLKFPRILFSDEL